MKNIQSFLLRFRTLQRTPPPTIDRYDPIIDQLIVEDNGTWKQAIISERYALVSKKADIEKGEDQKGP